MDLDELPAETAAEVKAAIGGLDFDEPARRRRRGPERAPAPLAGFGAGPADTFQYDLEVIARSGGR